MNENLSNKDGNSISIENMEKTIVNCKNCDQELTEIEITMFGEYCSICQRKINEEIEREIKEKEDKYWEKQGTISMIIVCCLCPIAIIYLIYLGISSMF